MKARILRMVRDVHRSLLTRPLPDNLSIYFHDLRPELLTRFEAAIRHFTTAGYVAVPAGAVADIREGEKKLFVSFDDNFRSWHEALPVMDRLGVRCTFYVNSGVLRDRARPAAVNAFFDRIEHRGRRETLSCRELVDLHRAGHRIGCHTHTHPVLSRLPRAEWHAEIDASKAVLEDLIEAPVTDFSYPFGMRRHFSRRLRRHCLDAGFRTIATGISGLQANARRDPLALHRTEWKFGVPLDENLLNLRVDARLYAAVTGRSAIG